MKKDHFKIAFQGVSSRKLRSWLTMIGIFIGVAAVVALIGLGDGLRLAITSQFGISSTEVLSVQAGGISSQGHCFYLSSASLRHIGSVIVR